VDSGARNIDFIIDRTVLPAASKALLLRMTQEEALPSRLVLGLDEDGNFTYSFDGEVAEEKAAEQATASEDAASEKPVSEDAASEEPASEDPQPTTIEDPS